jgi:ferredoxin
MAEPNVDEIYERIALRIKGIKDSKALPKIFQKLLTLEQAKLVQEFPATAEELAAKVGRRLESVKKDLQYFYELGLGTPSSRSGKWNLPRSYMLLVDKVGSHHRKFLPFLGPDYLDLWHELEEDRARTLIEETGTVATGERRIIPAYLMVKDNPELQPWENMKAILQMADKISLVNCTCRSKNRKKTCQMHTDEVCFLLNRDADYAVDSGAGRYLTVDEGLRVVENCEKVGVVHITANTRAVVSLLCNCCNDCCAAMKRFYRCPPDGRDWFRPSRYLAVINETLCKGCGTCVKRCFFDAITIKKNAAAEPKAVIDATLCKGCGNCGITCPCGVIELKCVRSVEHVPKGMWTRPGEVRAGEEYEKYLNL